MAEPRRGIEQPSADDIAGAARRARKLVNHTGMGTKYESMAYLLELAVRANVGPAARSAARHNTRAAAAVAVGTSAALLRLLKARKNKKQWRPSLVEQIKAPMTRAEARILTQRLNDPDRPKRKLPPRP